MEDPTSCWGAGIDEYPGSYKLEDFHVPTLDPEWRDNVVAHSLRSLRDLADQNRDLDAPASAQISILQPILALPMEPNTLFMLVRPRLIGLLIKLMSTVTVSGEPAPFQYEFGYLCFRIFVLAFSVSLVYRMDGPEQLEKEMESQPLPSVLQILAGHAISCAERLARVTGDENYCDHILGWAKVERSPLGEPDAIVSWEDAGKLFDLIWADRKNYLKALSITYLPGVSPVVLLLWRYWERKRYLVNRSCNPSSRITLSPFLDLMVRYWLVAPPDEEAPLQGISVAIGFMKCKKFMSKVPQFVDAEDSTSIVQAYNNRIRPAHLPMTHRTSFGTVSLDTLHMHLRFVRWHLHSTTDELFVLTFRVTFALIHDSILCLSRSAEGEPEEALLFGMIARTMTLLRRVAVLRLQSTPTTMALQFVQNVVSRELMDLTAVILLTVPFYRLWNESITLAEGFLHEIEHFFESVRHAIPGFVYRVAFGDLFPPWMRTRLQLSLWESPSLDHFYLRLIFWDRIGGHLRDVQDYWDILNQVNTCGYSRCPGTPLGSPAMFACSGCRYLYCSARCQTYDWTQSFGQIPHRESCSGVAR